ncbi:SDR family NAD(P)-dependent oxidoreductase [Sphingopyxis sp.]|jgi:2-hydroxycyclohexanecarboxyl-CoA dehydrogenase|uniref:SDR family NAD(P)-dependent oxidoreductase n=1 Tax=Sphingopyxis sp. TaxID=1908224 RepID=UPI003F7146C9
MMEKPLCECGVAILGGTAGVGFEAAAQFAETGARVVVLGRNDDRGAAAVAKLLARVPGGSIAFVRVDAADAQDAVRAENEARVLLGQIDVLMCTTGPSHPPELLHEIPIDEVMPRIDEITRPPLHMMSAVLPAMRAAGGGAMVIVASDAAKTATPGETLVGAAMGCIVMFARAAALEEKRRGIRINLLTPSLIADTPGAALIDSSPFAAKLFQKAAAMAHLGVADASDLAAMALYLASPAARRITGQAISINGGISVA